MRIIHKKTLKSLSIGLLLFTCGAWACISANAEGESYLEKSEIIRKLIPVTGETERTLDLALTFRINSAELTERSVKQLDELAAALTSKQLSSQSINIYGHTDLSGTKSGNMALSLERAQAVVQYLTELHKISPDRFEKVIGYGPTYLLTGISPTSPMHRRVEIVTFQRDNKNKHKDEKSGSIVIIN